jgi:hypothetical protein
MAARAGLHLTPGVRPKERSHGAGSCRLASIGRGYCLWPASRL